MENMECKRGSLASIHKCDLSDTLEVLFVINKSNAEAYRRIIPPEYFRKPVFTYDDILRRFEEMTLRL